jgi:hypothetical protein
MVRTRYIPGESDSIVRIFQRIPLGPLYAVAAIGTVIVFVLGSGDWRLLAVAITALCFNTATALLTLRVWPTAIAVLGVGLTYVQQSVALIGMCLAGLLGHMDEIGPYTIMLGSEVWVLLLFCMVSVATLLFLTARRFTFGLQRNVDATKRFQEVAQDSRLEIILIAAAGFTLAFWMGGELGFGLLRAVFLTLQRAFMFVPFLAGFYFRVSRRVTIIWILTVLANLALGIITGGRGPAFVPIALYGIGVFMGATARQRWYVLGLIVVLAIPLAYIFGMIEIARTTVGRLRVSEITNAKISEVATELQGVKEASKDPYEQLPTWVRTNFRLLTWPNVVVAASTGGEGPYRGFSDLPQQIIASLNVVSLTGEVGEYYNEGLFNLRASDYGFTVDSGTSVEFGFLAESWDRGGPVAAFIYALVAIAALSLTEAGVRHVLAGNPALRTVAVSVIFTTAFWTLNIYNLPLSLRQIPVNLIICYAVFGVVSLLATKTAGRRRKKPGKRSRIKDGENNGGAVTDEVMVDIP